MQEMWSDAHHAIVLELAASGLSDREIARRTSVPRATVGHWRRNASTVRHGRLALAWRPPDPVAYCYLLGLYLGDGHIVQRGRSAQLSITLDACYPGLVDEAEQALATTFPGTRVTLVERGSARAFDLRLSSSSLPSAFPQCGPGRKHQRSIALSSWQRTLTSANPRALIRGLIHSDGCRSVNRFETTLPSGRTATYEYVRYFFSNLSDDIRGIFAEHCELLGISWTLSNPRNISIARRGSVALLDEFVGPKR